MGEGLGFGEKEKGTYGLEGGRRWWNGSAQRMGFQQKEGARGILAKNFKYVLGSTLGVDSWHRKIQKNDEIILKKFKILGERCLSKKKLIM